MIFDMMSSYFSGFITSQVPSERRVMTVPSGRVTLAVENE
jgi:hypothetical protein